MGCASSKQSKCRDCKAPYPPMSRRSFSMNVHHPPERKGDSYHVVALTSSTLDSINLDPINNSKWDDFREDDQKPKNHEAGIGKSKKFVMEMIEAKAWSKMVDKKITRVAPKTPIRTPPGEPETINVNDLMAGLEDTSPLRLGDHLKSISFHVSDYSMPLLPMDSPRSGGECQENGSSISKTVVTEFDPEVIYSFRKALEELSPAHPFYIQPRDRVCDQKYRMKGNMAFEVSEENLNAVTDEKTLNGFCHGNGFVERIMAEEEKENLAPTDNGDINENGFVEDNDLVDQKRAIIYFTSLRGVRKTYDDCCFVRLMLKGLGVRVDEKDVSMHLRFKEELKELLGEGIKGGLPKVFVGNKYIGGADEIRRLNEDGKLEKVFEGCEMMDDEGGNLTEVCEACGDVRFVPCETCSGSCKIYYECKEDDAEYVEGEYGFQRCPDCNENGLIRCPWCCY